MNVCYNLTETINSGRCCGAFWQVVFSLAAPLVSTEGSASQILVTSKIPATKIISIHNYLVLKSWNQS